MGEGVGHRKGLCQDYVSNAKLRPDDNMHLKFQEGSFLTDTLDIHLLD